MIYCNDDFISDGVKESFNEQVARGLNRRIMVAGPITRRMFIGRTGKIIGFGALAHFTLLAGDVFGADDDCPGGLNDDDVCNPPDNKDKCPGENTPDPDVCEYSLKPEDACESGVATADKCRMFLDDSDQCESGTPADDICPEGGTIKQDVCPTGQAPEDHCGKDGGVGVNDGDVCFGGGAATNGQEQDKCMDDGAGDECTPGSTGEGDDCREPPEGDSDNCTLLDDDVCYNGTNDSGAGGNDWCDPNPLWPPVGSTGSDQCPDGTDAQDICNGAGRVEEDGLYDTCPGGGVAVDICDPSIPSDDYCLGGLNDNDECGAPADADECPGGGPNEDVCPTGEAPEDECTSAGGCAGGDQTGPEPPIDNCNAPDDACTMESPDNAE